MESHEDVFFSLLQCGLNGGSPSVPPDFCQWEKVLHLARSQSVLGIVGEVMLTDKRIEKELPAVLKAKVKAFLMANMMTSGRLNAVLVKVVTALRDAGIPTVLLKGQGLAYNYPKPELRQCGDIDLYVGLDNYDTSYDVLKPLATEIDDRKALLVGKHYDLSVGPVAVEIHRYTDRYPTSSLDRIYQKISLRGMTEDLVPLEFGGVSVDTPSDDYNAFYIFSHLFHHFLINGLGTRHLCDWMLFLRARAGHIDKDRLESVLKSLDMLDPWQDFGCLLVSYLGMREEDFPFYDPSRSRKAEKIIRRIIDEGNFGKERAVYRKRGRIYLLNKAWAMSAHIARSVEFLFLYPRHSFRQIWHTVSNGFEKVWNDARIRAGRQSS